MVRIQKLTRNLFVTLHGHNTHRQRQKLSKFLMRYQQFASHAYCGAAGPISKMASPQEKAFCVLRFEVSRSVITVQREFHAQFRKDAPARCVFSELCTKLFKLTEGLEGGEAFSQANIYSILTPWCRVRLEKLTGLQLVEKFPAFHGTRGFITALTSVRHHKQTYTIQFLHYVRAYVCMHICIYIYTHIYIQIYTHTHIYIHIHILYIFIYAYMCLDICIYTIYMHTDIHI